MTDFAARISGAAMLALAALPILALSTAAQAETRVRVADINPLTPEGVAAFNQRADAAVRTFCAPQRTLSGQAACRVGVKAELREKLDALRAARLEQASQVLAVR